MNHRELVAWWDEAFEEGVWWAGWRRALEGLTAAEAAWSPAPGRHSIWQVVEHMIFWRGYIVHRARGGEPADAAEVDRRNWQGVAEVSEEAWRATRERFAESHARVRAVMADPGTPPPAKPQLDLRYLLFHDNYHMGQVMYIRALLGKEALES